MEQLDRIEAQLARLSADTGKLFDRLYGANGFEGDIPEIKNTIAKHSDVLQRHEKDIRLQDERWKGLKWIVGLAIASGATGIGAMIKSMFG